MYEIDTSSFFSYLQTILRFVGGSLRFDPAAFLAAFNGGREATPVLIWIVLIGGLSLMIGHSVVLFANRVNTVRFALSLVLGALKFLLDVILVVMVVWLMANIFSTRTWQFGQVARAIALASAPYWLSFFFLIPYAGLIWERLTRIYVFLLLITAIQNIFGSSFFDGLLASLIVFVLVEVISLIVGRLFTPLANRFTNALLGDLQIKNTQQIYKIFVHKNLVVRE